MLRPSACAVLLVFAACSAPEGPGPVEYPETRTENHVDTYHGIAIADPYRWLEDLDAEATAKWVEAQNETTFGYLRAIPQRDAIRERLEEVWNYPREGAPFRRGGRWFQFRNDGLQDHAVLYWRDGKDGAERVLIDPNRLSEDGSVSLAAASVSENGRYVAYSTSVGGSDWQEWHVRDVATTEDLPDVLEWVKFSGAEWLPDESGFFYGRYPAPKEGEEREQANYHHKLYFHRVGTPQDQDVLVCERPDEKEWGFAATVTDDGRYLVITAWVGTDTRNRIFYKDLETDEATVQALMTALDGSYSFVGSDGGTFFFRTDADAPKGRIIAVDVEKPDRASWRDLVPEGSDTLDSARLVAHRLVAFYMQDAHDRAAVHSLDGTKEGDIPLPGIGAVGQATGRREDESMYFTWTSFIEPTSLYRYDFADGRCTMVKRPEVAFDPDRFETKQIWFTSKDGTRVPMFVTHKKGLSADGSNPTYLYGYGGFNISLTPAFSVSVLVWMEMGGIFAQASLRGGGEYGEAWHDAGKVHQKQNVFDDFIGAAEWLVTNKWTRPDRLAIGGGSNGGLLVAACMNQRPDLFGACLPAVGVMDMLRFHKFTIGWAWVPEYGSSEDPQHFATLRAYSPLHNLRSASYPATLVTTADHDDRVVPAHSFKYAARLQSVQQGDAPCLIRIETKAGHGAGVPTSKQIEEAADRWAFLAYRFGMVVPW
ncbi:MAG: S9 family peptidase [Planctomycetes bacterium]|nr:S9 family peptidase [Planctomycetota bacterium]